LAAFAVGFSKPWEKKLPLGEKTLCEAAGLDNG
jgi:hypothetical protein